MSLCIIRTHYGARARDVAALCYVRCEGCGKRAEHVYGDTEFDCGLARAAATSAGFSRRIRGRVSRDYCAGCAKGPTT